MAMPKTAVDKNYCFIFLQNYIGGAGQFPIVDSEPQTAGKQIFAHNQLGTSVFALYRSHASATLSGCHHVGHAKGNHVRESMKSMARTPATRA